uniref:CIA30 domain-containing protein n=1 Tax=Strongyloides papillosus TaxID=174720 RepID=A0A0N5BAX5_STREA
MLSRSSFLFRRLATKASDNIPTVVPKDESKKQNKIKKKEYKAKVSKATLSLFGNRPAAPTSLAFPNKKGEEGYDPEVPIKELVNDGPKIIKEELSKFIHEASSSASIEKIQLIEDIGILRHGDTKIEYQFKKESDMDKWGTGCDSDWGKGFSTCSFKLTDDNTAVFSGNLVTQIPRDGKVEKAGWASIKTIETNAFMKKKYLSRWSNYSHLIIKCRGDGRSYKVMLHAPGHIDLTWGDTFSYPLHTHGGPYWQIEKIPFSRFFHTVYGRIQDVQEKVYLNKVSSFSIVLMDKIDGPFNLEIDFIGVTHDKSHQEKSAYESYELPIFNSQGF